MIKGLQKYYSKLHVRWIAILFIASLMLSVYYYGIIQNQYGNGCILDAFHVLPQNYVFPVLAMIYGMWCSLTSRIDSNPMIVLYYGNRKKLWYSQNIFIAITSAISVFVICLGSMLAAKLLSISVIYNWNCNESFFLMLYQYDNLDVSHMVHPIQIVLGSIIIFFLLFYITGNIVFLINNVTNNTMLSILGLSIICGCDTLVRIIKMPILYCRFQVYRIMWIEPLHYWKNFFIINGLILILSWLGFIAIESREYI